MIRELIQIDSNDWELKLHKGVCDFFINHEVEPTIIVNREFLTKAEIPASSLRCYCSSSNPNDSYFIGKYKGYTIKIDDSVDPDFVILTPQSAQEYLTWRGIRCNEYVNEDLPWY